MFTQQRNIVLLALLSLPLMLSVAQGGGFRPDRLLLTWKEDPTSTMVLQWLQEGQLNLLAESSSEEERYGKLPLLEGSALSLDGDWTSKARKVAFLADGDHDPQPRDGFEATLFLGWTEEGLLLGFDVEDPEIWEHPEEANIWDGDGVEIFISPSGVPEERLQLVIAPGRDPELDTRHRYYGPLSERSDHDWGTRIDVHAEGNSYQIRVLIPWSDLPSLNGEVDEVLLLQTYVNRRDASGEDFHWVGLHPSRYAHGNPGIGYAFQLGSSPIGATEWVRAEVSQPGDAAATLNLYGDVESAGTTVTLRTGEIPLGETTLEWDGQRSHGAIAIPLPPEDRRWGHLMIESEGIAFTIPAPSSAIYQYYAAPEPIAVAVWAVDEAEEDASVHLPEVAAVEVWAGKFRQRVALTGLKPDTRYRFRAGEGQLDYGFRTMPATLNRPIRFATGGDTRHRQDWMEQVNRVALSYEPEFLVWGGDLAYADGRSDRAYRWAEWFDANYNALLDEERNVLPIVVCIGNHEVIGGYYTAHSDYEQTDAFRESIAPYFYDLFAFPGQPGWGALDFGDYLSFIILDSAHSNPVEGKQTDWLASALEERQGITHLFPVYHVPAFPSHRPYTGRVATAVRENWVPLFEANQVRIAFEHHDHTYKRTHPIRSEGVADDGIIYFGDGAWGVGVRPGDSRDEWYINQFASERHAIIVTLDGKERHFLVVNEDGEVIDELRDPPFETTP